MAVSTTRKNEKIMNLLIQYTIQPSLDQVKSLLITEKRGNIVPLYTTLPGDLLTAVGAYLKISENSKYSFLFESVVGGERIGRHDFVGAGMHFTLSLLSFNADMQTHFEFWSPARLRKTLAILSLN